MQYNPTLYETSEYTEIPTQEQIKGFLEHFLDYLQCRTSHNSVRTARSILNRYTSHLVSCSSVPLEKATVDFINQFKTPSYRHSVIYYLRYFWSVSGYPDDKSPAHSVDYPQVNPTEGRAFFNRDEIQALYKLLEEENRNGKALRETAAVTLMLYTGLRASEVLALKKSDLSPDGLVVRESKTHSSRVIGVSKAPLDAVQAFHAAHPSSSSYIIYIKGSLEPMSYSALWRSIKALYRKAGIEKKNLGLHALRHTFVRALEESGKVDIEVIQKLLGHSRLETTQLYRRLFNSDILRRTAIIEDAITTYIGGEQA